MKVLYRYIGTIIIVFLATSFLWAQPIELSQYKIRNWTTDDGLPSNTLLRLHQDNSGYLWITSYDGLTRFDGTSFVNLTKSNGLPSSQVQGIETDADGQLLIGTGAGLMHYRYGKFVDLTHGNDLFIQTIYLNHNKSVVYIGTRGQGLYTFNLRSNEYTKIQCPYDRDIVRTVLIDQKGNLWVGGETLGLSYFNNDKWTSFKHINGLKSKINSLYLSNDGLLYAGTNEGLFVGGTSGFYEVEWFRDKSVNNIKVDAHGYVWVLTSNGLYRKKPKSNQWEYLGKDEGLSNSDLLDILFDTEGSIWMTTYRGGLVQLSDRKFKVYSVETGLSSDETGAIEEIGKGEFLVGSVDAKLNLIKDGKVYPFKTKTILRERIHDIHKDEKHNIWIAAHNGLLLIKPDGTEKFFNESNGLFSDQIWVIKPNPNGGFWLGSRTGGIIKMEFEKFPDKPVFTTYKSDEIKSSFIMSISYSKAGDMIVGTNTAGVSIISKDGKVKNYGKEEGMHSNVVFNSYVDADNNIWLATTDGLTLLQNGELFSYTFRDGLPFESIMDILDDGQGYFWLPSSIGIIRVAKHLLLEYKNKSIDYIDWKLFNKNDGMKRPQCTGASHSFKASDGTLWFPTLGGVAWVNPAEVIKNNVPLKVYLEHVLVDDVESQSDKQIILNPGRHRIVFQYTALSLRYPNSARYRYWLEGYDDKWVEAGTERQAIYTNLKNGTYMFHVMAANNDGVWSREITSVEFVVLPFYYQTVWFYMIIIVTVVALVWGYSRWRTYSLEKESQRLEAEVKKRTQELVEKNNEIAVINEYLFEQNEEIASMVNIVAHDLRSPLSKIDGFIYLLDKTGELNGEQKDYLNRIQQVISHGKALIRDLLDVHSFDYEESKPSYTQVDFKTFMSSWEQTVVQELKRKDQHLQLNVESAAHSVYIDPILVTRILDNLVSNASKFSARGKNIYVAVKQNSAHINFSVRDEGPGISDIDQKKMFRRFQKLSARPTEGESTNGLGLSIIKALTEKLNGRIAINSRLGVGTIFSVDIPLNHHTH
jgi:ligand-binding sensor domain-containing protein/signal transduction histidine kinase